MSIIFSRQCEYALQAVLFLALKTDSEFTSIKDLSKRLDLPSPFLAKILQSLAYKGLLKSHKGPNGGFGLAMPVKDITLFHIIEAIDGVDLMHKCVMGFPDCSDDHHCAVHETWGRLREEIYSMLVNKDIEQLAHELKKPEYLT